METPGLACSDERDFGEPVKASSTSTVGFGLLSLPASVVEQLLQQLPLADLARLSTTCQALRNVVQEHLAHRRVLSKADLPARIVRAAPIMSALAKVKQPRSLSLCISLLPDFSRPDPLGHIPQLIDTLGSFRFLTTVVFLIDEPRSNPLFHEFGIKQEQFTVAQCVEAVCLSAAPLRSLTAGGLRYLSSASLTRGLSLLANYKQSITSLHLMRLENLTCEDLAVLTPPPHEHQQRMPAPVSSLERSSSSGDDWPSARLSSSLPSGLEPLSAHIDRASLSGSWSAAGGSHSSLNATTKTVGSIASNLMAFSLMECSNVTDQGLAEFLRHTCQLQFVALVPDDHVTVSGISTTHHRAPGAHEPHANSQPIGAASLSALAASSACLKKLYLSEELSPASFGECSLNRLLGSASGQLEEVFLNVPIHDEQLLLLARNCKHLQKVTFPASNVSDSALSTLFKSCIRLHSATLCGSQYFGSRSIDGTFLRALFSRSKALTNLSLDCMNQVTAEKLWQVLQELVTDAAAADSSTLTSLWVRDGGQDARGAPAKIGGSGTFISQLESLRLRNADSFGAELDAAVVGEALSTIPCAVVSSTENDHLDGVPATEGPVTRVSVQPEGCTALARGAGGPSSTEERWRVYAVNGDQQLSSHTPCSRGTKPQHSTQTAADAPLCSSHQLLAGLTGDGQHDDQLFDPTSLQKVTDRTSSCKSTVSSVSAAVLECVREEDRHVKERAKIVAKAGSVDHLLGSLTSLALDNMPRLREGGAEALGMLLMHAPQLRSLSLQAYDGPVDAVLEAAVLFCPQLTEVNIGGCRHLTDSGLLALCRLSEHQLVALGIQSCLLVTPHTIEAVLHWHCGSMREVDLWGTRACGPGIARLLTSGQLRRVNIGGTFFGDGVEHEGLLQNVMRDIPSASGTDVTNMAQSVLLAQRVMFGPRFVDVLTKSGTVLV